MSFEYAVSQALLGDKPGESRIHISSKDRPNMSLSKLQEGNNNIEIKSGEVKRLDYESWHNARFLFAKGIESDALLTFFEVNNSKLVAFRGLDLDYKSAAAIRSEVRKILSPKPNLESRIIGFSNGTNIQYLRDMLNLSRELKAKLVESDTFGNELRHVAIDSRFGISYNVLLENRPYRAGELIIISQAQAGKA